MTGLSYQGSKRRLIGWLFDRLPPAYQFVDLCGGGASVATQASGSGRYAEVVYNDIDEDVVNFFRVAREHGDRLAALIAATPYSRAEFLACHEPATEPVERARRFYVRLYQSFNGLGLRKDESPTWLIKAHRKNAECWASRAAGIPALVEPLRRVAIENVDALKAISIYDKPDALFYADPPYLRETQSTDREYQHDMTEQEHRGLIAALNHAQGNAAISGYRSPLYDELLGAWARYDKAHTTSLSNGGERVECLWVKRVVEPIVDLFGRADNGR